MEAVTFFCRRLFLLLVSLDVLLHIFQATMGKEEDAGDVQNLLPRYTSEPMCRLLLLAE